MLSFPPLPQQSRQPQSTTRSLSIQTPTGSRVYVRTSALEALKPKRPLKTLSRSNSFRDNSSVAETESCTDHSSVHGRLLTWAWKEAILVENNDQRVVLQLTNSVSSAPDTPITLPATAWTADLVWANEYETCPETSVWQPPHDLIQLTHLHEPAVVEALQHRFASDQIYTNTGPVLLALNPFTQLRGLYGESMQKKYWERAEQQSDQELPPHVYAIADASFRDMMRLLEDGLPPHQSILVSGESGAGKTVTTKFVMKYLAALSQRSAELRSPAPRAYLKVQPSVLSPSKTRQFQSKVDPPKRRTAPEPD